VSVIHIAAVLLTLSALLGYLNHRFTPLPPTIGMMVMGLFASLCVVAVDHLVPGLGIAATVKGFVGQIDFDRTLMEGMLSVLLFAGALHVNVDDLMERGAAIGALATVGVVVSTAVVGVLAYVVLAAVGHPVPLAWCLVFGALISPTDPIAVLGILKTAGASRTLSAKITGESLLNDGVGVVVFTALLAFAGTGGHGPGAETELADIAMLFVEEVAGGALLGLAAGYVAYRGMRSIDHFPLEVLITVALVLGTYSLAGALHVSGPIAVVVAGILTGNHGTRLAMSDTTADHVASFWTLNDEILNAVLFLLIGLEVLAVNLEPSHLLAGALLIPVCLLARLVSVAAPISLLGLWRDYGKGTIPVLTWAGLKGGISIALALSLPAFPDKTLIVTGTYVVVLFSIVVQGLTIGRVVGWVHRSEGEEG
jgi:CPA1 family monovalent cation:H+ antiporter